MRRSSSILLAIGLCVCSVAIALGASVTITSTGAGSFAVQGDSMNGVAGIELTMGYDASLLASPSVTWGSLVSGAMSVANTAVPGAIRIAIIRTEPFSGSGPIASVTFATQSSSGGITSVTARLIDSKGATVPSQASIATGAGAAPAAGSGLVTTPGVPFSQSEQPRVSPAGTAATTPTVATGLGAVSMPDDTPPRGEAQPVDPKPARVPEPAEAAEPATAPEQKPSVDKAAETVEPGDVKQTAYSGVLDRFRSYQGEKSPEIMAALFMMEIAPNVRQEPAVVISDGEATVRVVVDLPAGRGASTSFALTGARLVSLKKEDDADSWVLEALPREKTLKANVTILTSSSVIEFPLTVVPPAAAVSVKPADFAAFLKDSGARSPKHDLNGDGRHDYLDDFIYTAHYLVATGAAAKRAR